MADLSVIDRVGPHGEMRWTGSIRPPCRFGRGTFGDLCLVSRSVTIRFSARLAALALALGSACSGGADDESTAQVRPAGAATFGGPARRCADRVEGELTRDWRRHPDTVTAGPLAWPYLRETYVKQPRSLFAAKQGRYQGQKALLVVDAGAVVNVAVQARPRASLLYDPAVFNDANLYRLSDGSKSFTFRACPDEETRFNGGFVVAGVQCLRVDVSWRTPSGVRSAPAFLPFGTGDEPCPPG